MKIGHYTFIEYMVALAVLLIVGSFAFRIIYQEEIRAWEESLGPESHKAMGFGHRGLGHFSGVRRHPHRMKAMPNNVFNRTRCNIGAKSIFCVPRRLKSR
jgi:hypothetical protein